MEVANPGDFLLAHRSGAVSVIIRAGQRVRDPKAGAHWSHVAYVETPDMLIEALTHGVKRTPITEYADVPHRLVRTHLDPLDERQATAFAQSCVGQKYGFAVILGIALRYLTPGRGLWLGMNGTEICSGLCAQALCRGWANFPYEPSSMTPSELAACFPEGASDAPPGPSGRSTAARP